MTQALATWNLQGDYFENCNCDLICPCEVSAAGPLAAPPTQGYCDVLLAIHIDRGSYDGASLDGLTAVLAGHVDGPMGNGGWKVALYFDERAGEQQRPALEAIFSGSAGGPMGAFAPLIGEVLGMKYVPITYTKDGKRRAVQIPNVAQMAVQAIPSMKPDGSEVWLSMCHPFNSDQLAVAVGEQGSTFGDYGMRWDNSGKNGHYASINWSNA